MNKRFIIWFASLMAGVLLLVACVQIATDEVTKTVSPTAPDTVDQVTEEIRDDSQETDEKPEFRKISENQIQTLELATIYKTYPYNKYPKMTGKFTSLLGKVAFSPVEPKVAYSFRRGENEFVFVNGKKISQAEWVCNLSFTEDGKQLKAFTNRGEQVFQSDISQQKASEDQSGTVRENCPFEKEQVNENDIKYIEYIGKGATAECFVNVHGKKGKKYPVFFQDDVGSWCPISNVIYDEEADTIAYSVNEGLIGFVVVNEKEGKHYTAIDNIFFTPQKKVGFRAMLKPFNPGQYVVGFRPLPEESLEYLVINGNELSSFHAIYTESIRYSRDGSCMLYGALLDEKFYQVSEALLPTAKDNSECMSSKKMEKVSDESTPFALHVVSIYEGGVPEGMEKLTWIQQCKRDLGFDYTREPEKMSEFMKKNSDYCFKNYANNYHQQGIVKVHVKDKSKPVVLALTAYEPTLWEITKDNGVRIEKIILGGYEAQEVKGVTGVPTESIDGLDSYSGDRPSALISQLEVLLDAEHSSFQESYKGETFTINAAPQRKVQDIPASDEAMSSATPILSEALDQGFLLRAKEVASAIHEKNFEELALLVHPTLGLTIHSWAIPDRASEFSSEIFLPDQIRNFKATDSFTIGIHPATGKTLIFTPTRELDRYIAGNDVRYNPSQNVERGGGRESDVIVDGIHKAFPDSAFVEYTWQGSTENSNLDWKKTFHIFQKHNDGKWYLVALTEYYWIP